MNMSKDKFLVTTCTLVVDQDRIINELRTFIEIYLAQMLEFVEKENAGICQKYL